MGKGFPQRVPTYTMGKRGPKPSSDPKGRRQQIQTAWVREKRADVRDVQIPEVVNRRRRASCRLSLTKFCKTYFQHLYYLPAAPFQISRVEKIERFVLYGGQGADAEPRGTGKTTDALVSGLWGVLYGHKKHFFVIRANASESQELIRDAKHELETNDMLLEDFPEVCAPIRALEGAAQRTGSQTANGERTRIVYKSDYIVLPTVAGSQASGTVFSSSGIEGKIRGRKIGGHRPDLVLMDDIEDPESAASTTQMDKIERVILADIGGLAGPSREISILWRGTILRRGCLIDQYTDRIEHPEWEGTRQAAIEQWPERLDLWKEYEEKMQMGKLDESDPHGRFAMEFYKANRKEMDKGLVVAWKENYLRTVSPDGTPSEISAIQSLMNKRIKMGVEGFLTEYQNDPPEPPGASGITSKLIASRLSMFPYQVAPVGRDKALVQYIDIGSREIHYVVLSVGENGSSCFIDYGIIEVRAPAGDLKKAKGETKQALEQAVLDALRSRRDELAVGETPYKTVGGDPMEVMLTLVDSGWLPDVVYKFTSESGPRWLPTKGDQLRAGNTRFSGPTKKQKGLRIGEHWYAKRQPAGVMLFHLDADHWKLYTHERFLQDPDTPGSATLYGNVEQEHRRFSRHLVAEEWMMEAQKWEQRSRYNHFFDCAAGAFAAMNMAGMRISLAGAPPQPDKPSHAPPPPQHNPARRTYNSGTANPWRR